MFGYLKFHGQEWPEILCDRIAIVAGNQPKYSLYFMSVVADAGIIKGLRGALNSHGMTADFTIRDLPPAIEFEDEEIKPIVTPAELLDGKTIARLAAGYESDTMRVAYNHVHAFFWAKDPLFLLAASDDHLWAQLKSPKYTTPLLRDWLPWIKQRLLDDGKFVKASSYRCECGGLNLATEELDAIVTEGIQGGHLIIPRRKDVA